MAMSRVRLNSPTAVTGRLASRRAVSGSIGSLINEIQASRSMSGRQIDSHSRNDSASMWVKGPIQMGERGVLIVNFFRSRALVRRACVVILLRTYGNCTTLIGISWTRRTRCKMILRHRPSGMKSSTTSKKCTILASDSLNVHARIVSGALENHWLIKIKRRDMGWWKTGQGDDILGDRPADIVAHMLDALAETSEETKQRKPKLREVLEVIAAALRIYPETFLDEGK